MASILNDDDLLIRRIDPDSPSNLTRVITLSPGSFMDEGKRYTNLSFFLARHFNGDMQRLLVRCCNYSNINRAISQSVETGSLSAREYYDYGYRLASISVKQVKEHGLSFKEIATDKFVSANGHVDVIDGQEYAVWFAKNSLLLPEQSVFPTNTIPTTT